MKVWSILYDPTSIYREIWFGVIEFPVTNEVYNVTRFSPYWNTLDGGTTVLHAIFVIEALRNLKSNNFLSSSKIGLLKKKKKNGSTW